MKLCFVSVNGPREPYLLDEPCMFQSDEQKQKYSPQNTKLDMACQMQD
jgi:hypothetical protein